MSLVNLAHVCSHLQNASLARLGLTSIPYTKWHLSLALLLQKQGFLSQVKLGGPSPPASCFGHGPRDDHHVTNFPHGAAGRNPYSSESALAQMIRKGYDRYRLKEEGFNQDAIDFAEEHGRRTLAELEAQGWPERARIFIFETTAYLDQLIAQREQEHQERTDAQRDPQVQAVMDAEIGATSEQRRLALTEQLLASVPHAQATLYRKYSHLSANDLHYAAFDLADLEAIAGKNAYVSEGEIRRNGITVEAMGLQFPNQSITLPVEEYQDPDGMETEGVVTQANRASRRLWLGLKYYESSPVLSKARMISKPTKRIWLSSKELARVVRGHAAGEVKAMSHIGEIIAVSTEKGIMEARDCVERQLGGMAMCRVW